MFKRRIIKWIQDANSGEVIMDIKLNLVNGATLLVGLALDNEGSLYASTKSMSNSLWKLHEGEENKQIIDSGLGKLTHLFFDRKKSIYAGDEANNRVIKIDLKTNEISVVVDGLGRNGTDQLFQPESVLVDQFDTVYVVEKQNHRVTQWLPGAASGIVIIGGYGAGYQSDQLDSPTDIDMDRDGNIYVVDQNNHRVQKFIINRSSC